MFDFEYLIQLSSEEAIILNDLHILAQKAVEAEKLIKETYVFHIGEDRIEVWSDSNNFEYLNYDGTWACRYLNYSYDLSCSAESIFDHLKADYLMENDYAKKYGEEALSELNKKAFALGYFKVFLKRTKELHDKQTNNK